MYIHSTLMEATILTALGVAAIWLSPAYQATALIVGLSFLMGLQNAIVTQISDARVRTSHISGMATDIGIGCGLLFDIAWGISPTADSQPILARLRLHLITVLSFLFGGIVGVLSFQIIGKSAVFLAAVALFLIAGTGILRLRRHGVETLA